MKLDEAIWARLFPFLEQSHDVPNNEIESWLAEVASQHPDLAVPLRELVMERQHLDTQGFLEQPLQIPADPPPRIGQRVGSYTIESLLGKGGMGAVWLAQRSDGHFKGVFAVKFLNLASPAANAALLVSARIAIAERRFADAEKTANEALVLFQNRARQPELSADVGESLLLLALAQQGLGQPGAAADFARRAEASLAAGLGGHHPLTQQAAALLAI